jgi:hypothetical protein
MIELSVPEKKWILLCKGHLQEKYPFTGKWVNTLKPLFVETYGWNPDENNQYYEYLNCIFNKLLDIQFKISDDKSGYNRQLKEIFQASFSKSFSREEELPIERAIGVLCGLIQCNLVIEDDDVERYSLKY